MKNEKLNDIIESMKDKIGKETSALINDSFMEILTDNSSMNEIIKTKDDEINTLKKDKEELIKTNGNLVQQVTASVIDFSNEENDEKNDNKYENLKREDFYDAKGNYLI